MTPNGEPMTLLPLDATVAEIGTAVLESLRGSQDGLTVEEFDSQMSLALESTGEESWDSVEQTWELIGTTFEESETVVVCCPMRRYETGGWVSFNEDPVFRCPAEPENVGKMVRKIVDGPPLDVEPHEPSHT